MEQVGSFHKDNKETEETWQQVNSDEKKKEMETSFRNLYMSLFFLSGHRQGNMLVKHFLGGSFEDSATTFVIYHSQFTFQGRTCCKVLSRLNRDNL